MVSMWSRSALVGRFVSVSSIPCLFVSRVSLLDLPLSLLVPISISIPAPCRCSTTRNVAINMLRRFVSSWSETWSIFITSALSIPTSRTLFTMLVGSVVVVVVMLASLLIPGAVFLRRSGEAATAALCVITITASTRSIGFSVGVTPRLHLCFIGCFGVQVSFATAVLIPNGVGAVTCTWRRARAVVSGRGFLKRAVAARWCRGWW